MDLVDRRQSRFSSDSACLNEPACAPTSLFHWGSIAKGIHLYSHLIPSAVQEIRCSGYGPRRQQNASLNPPAKTIEESYHELPFDTAWTQSGHGAFSAYFVLLVFFGFFVAVICIPSARKGTM
jgi:hypothetical protein